MPPLSDRLSDLQSALRDVSLGGDAGGLAAAIIGDGFAPEQRLNVHRNNTTILLSDALGGTYSVVKKLVGEEFFDAVARLYVRAQPPRSPCLFEYGEGFGDFLATMPSVAELPYLPDVAKLEWAWNTAFHAADAPALSAVALTGVAPDICGDLVFTPHPSVQLVRSPYPIKEIWDINQCNADPDAMVDLDEGGQALAVLRPKATVEMVELSPAGFVLAERLVAGDRLEGAFAAAQTVMPNFDPAATLAVLLGVGAFCSFTLKS
ncbi:DNA-binding domain-containing protein [Magnetovibrio sp.]|uniref:DNA-binding domain-containing protein n=1 Tax=Magnetovibrio sp. TaxID=2024836 RepID=UPI002F93A599